ncbi:thioredoxin family protein [Halobaculum sp. MBLA0147]|uniref:thioredoxin family protein n=1 Tax=Halobaculum sp. MBLA0147 TaxID=3079934 RepID=UPI0035242C5B
MSESDRIDEIRAQKREELLSEHGDGETADGAAAGTGTPSEPIHVDGADHLSELLATHDVVFADFYADWCGPCKQLEPTVEHLATQTDAAVVKVDIDANQQLAARYGVRSVPTMVLFADGEVAEQVVGVRGADRLADLIGRYT